MRFTHSSGKNGRKVYTHILAHVQLIGCFVFFWKVCLAHFRGGKSNLDQLLTIDYDRKRQYALAKRKWLNWIGTCKTIASHTVQHRAAFALSLSISSLVSFKLICTVCNDFFFEWMERNFKAYCSYRLLSPYVQNCNREINSRLYKILDTLLNIS